MHVTHSMDGHLMDMVGSASRAVAAKRKSARRRRKARSSVPQSQQVLQVQPPAPPAAPAPPAPESPMPAADPQAPALDIPANSNNGLLDVLNTNSARESSSDQSLPPAHAPSETPFATLDEWDRQHLRVMTIDLFVNGRAWPLNSVPALLKQRHDANLHNTRAHDFLRQEIASGRVMYFPPLHHKLATDLKKKFGLLDVRVTEGYETASVAAHASRMLFDLLKALHRLGIRKPGYIFAGGYTAYEILWGLRNHLMRSKWDPHMAPRGSLPESMHITSFNGNLIRSEPHLNPNHMLVDLFKLQADLEVAVTTEGFQVSPLVEASQVAAQLAAPYAQRVRAKRMQQHVLVMGCGQTSDPACSFTTAVKEEADGNAQWLQDFEVIGNFGWLPVTRYGDIRKAPGGALGGGGMRAVTLMDLPDIAHFVEHHNGKVMLVSGPCRDGGLKTEIIRILLEHQPRIVTHACFDLRTAISLMNYKQPSL